MPHNRIAAVAHWNPQSTQTSAVPSGFMLIPAVLVVQSSQTSDWQLDLYRRAREQAEATLRSRHTTAKLFAIMN